MEILFIWIAIFFIVRNYWWNVIVMTAVSLYLYQFINKHTIWMFGKVWLECIAIGYLLFLLIRNLL